MERVHSKRWAIIAGGLYLATLATNRALREVTGSSMLPSLWPGDRIVVLPARARRPRRGDVVVLADPREPGRETIKRLVGLPGERVELRAGRLHVDGHLRREPWCSGPDASDAVWHLGDDELVVLGDHRAASTDSRTYGAVPVTAVRWVGLVRAAPVATLRRVPAPDDEESS